MSFSDATAWSLTYFKLIDREVDMICRSFSKMPYFRLTYLKKFPDKCFSCLGCQLMKTDSRLICLRIPVI